MNPITHTGYERLSKRLEELKTEYDKMPAIIKTARDHGDLKENAEYHAAREKQGMLKAQIDKLSGDLSQSQIVDPASLPPGIVTFGKKVTLHDLDSRENIIYRIAGPAEAEFANNEIPVNSLIGRGLLGKKPGDQAVIQVPSGTKRYKIEKIEL